MTSDYLLVSIQSDAMSKAIRNAEMLRLMMANLFGCSEGNLVNALRFPMSNPKRESVGWYVGMVCMNLGFNSI